MHLPTSRRRLVCRITARSLPLFAVSTLVIAPARAAAAPVVGPDSARRVSDSTRTTVSHAGVSRASADGTTVTPRGDDAPPSAAASWRARAGQHGLVFSVRHVTDASGTSSALDSRSSLRTYGSAEVTLHIDSLLPLHGLTVFAQYAAKSGRNLSAATAMMQNFSNIDADDFHGIGELWAEQRLFSSRVRVKAGRLDFNKEFAGTLLGGDFLNSSMGYSPSITAAPTYPLPSAGANVFVSPTGSLTLGAGVFNGVGGATAAPGKQSLFEIAQAAQQWTLPGHALAGRLSGGAWRHTGMFRAVDAAPDAAPAVSNITGWFTTLDQELWHGAARASGDPKPPTIATFVQAGRSDPRAQAVYTHAGGGLTFSGVVPHRSGDVFGIGVTRASAHAGREMVDEVYYQLPVSSHLALMADVQRVARRDWGAASRTTGAVSTLRTIIRF